MALDTLPDDGIIVKTRDEYRDLWLRSFKIRNPAASVAQDTQPWIDASTQADVLAPMSLNARTIGRSIPLSEVSGKRLDQRLAEYGLPPRFPETGSQGTVTITASSTGATIPAGTELTDADNGLRFGTILSGTYADQSTVQIAAIDTGTQTNLDAGTVLVWSTSIPGLFASCFVTAQTDGSGLSGGCAVESDDEVRARISEELANPAAAGNTSDYIKAVENSLAHGISVQRCFAYPAVNGPGTISVSFTLKPATAGGGRIPNPTQMALVMSSVVGIMPGDDSYLPVTLIAQPVDVSFNVAWATGAAGWADIAPWPVYDAPGAHSVVVSSASSPVSFVLATSNADYSGVQQPTVGTNIGFWDQSGVGQFRQKRLLTVTGTGPWTCVADTSNGASDTTYTPAIGQRACPWSDSLPDLAGPVLSYFGTLGPGEMFGSFFDPGVRQRRQPVSPRFWPNVLGNRITTGLLALPSVGDIDFIDGINTTTTIGVPGSTAYLIELGFLSAFPL
jgi:uncharacterized phage protein gp47/JayE